MNPHVPRSQNKGAGGHGLPTPGRGADSPTPPPADSRGSAPASAAPEICSKWARTRINHNFRSERQRCNRPDRAVPGRKSAHQRAHRQTGIPVASPWYARDVLGATPSPFGRPPNTGGYVTPERASARLTPRKGKGIHG